MIKLGDFQFDEHFTIVQTESIHLKRKQWVEIKITSFIIAKTRLDLCKKFSNLYTSILGFNRGWVSLILPSTHEHIGRCVIFKFTPSPINHKIIVGLKIKTVTERKK